MLRPATAAGLALVIGIAGGPASALDSAKPTRMPLFRVIDLDIGESSRIDLPDGSTAELRVDAVAITADPIRQAVREARVTVTINGQAGTLRSGNYELPRTI